MARTLATEAEAMDSPSPRKGKGATRAQQAEAGLSALAGELGWLLTCLFWRDETFESKMRAKREILCRGVRGDDGRDGRGGGREQRGDGWRRGGGQGRCGLDPRLLPLMH